MKLSNLLFGFQENMLYKVKHLKTFLLLFILSAGIFTYAQNAQIDSLKAVLGNLKEDTSRVNMLNDMAAIVFRTSPEEAITYSSDAKNIAGQIDFQKGLAAAYKNIGLGYYMQGNYTEALKNWEPALEIYQLLGDEQHIANIVNNLGSIFYTSGNNVQAIEYFLRALKTAEKLNDSIRIATLLLNIGNVYSEQPATLDTALNYYRQALSMGESIGYLDLLGVGSINVGELYFKKEAYDSALFYIEKSLALVESNIDIAASLNFLGRIYAEKGDYQTAINYQQDALNMAMKENAQLEIARILLGLASTYKKQGNSQLAIDYYRQAESIAEEIGLDHELSDAYKGLAYSYSDILDFQNAFQYLMLQNDIDNSIYRIETENKTNNLMYAYQLEKKENEIDILERESKIEQLTSKRQKAIIITIGVVGLLLLLLAVGIYKRMQFIRKTNEKIQSQKELITDSITYAQRIQSAILPSQSLLDEIIPEHFIFFKPKDIVSGDFYWMKEVQDHLIIVGADCTGHGVPGAFMSMLGITLLNGIIGDRCFNEPGAILEQLRVKIKEMLVQEGKVEEQKDGMDMAIVILDKNSGELHFSGANNPLYIIRNMEMQAEKQLESFTSLENGDYQLFELKGDKQPIGVHWEETDFTSHSISLQESDTFYIFSDGFVDQFGGENRKKFKSLNFKKLLLSIQKEPMERQKQFIEDTFETWLGDHEQIDDVSVIGVRI
ncbi:MAG: tetratricopeptide repeat protein [Bacteroidota bacterium]